MWQLWNPVNICQLSEPDSTIQIAASVRNNSTCSTNSTRSHARSFSNGSATPVMPGYHSPTSETSMGTPQQQEKPMIGCFSCPSHRNGTYDSDVPLFGYTSGMANNTNSHGSLFPNDSSTQMPSGLESVIENYMRSILRPEAFLTSLEPEEQAGTPFWNSNIDPSLPQIGPSVCTPMITDLYVQIH